MDPKLVQQMNQAANRFTEAIRELSQSVDRLAEHEETMMRVYRFWEELGEALREEGGAVRVLPVLPYRVGLPEKEAAALAIQTVREVRGDLWREREPEAPTPTPDEIEEWERAREARREREGYQPR